VDSERFQHAMSLRMAGKEQDALQELETLASLATDPCEYSSLLLGQATCLLGLGRVKEARQRWLESARRWTNLYTELIDAYLCAEEGKREEAVHKLTRILESYSELGEPGNEDTYSEASEWLGQQLSWLKRYAEAVQPFKKALAFPETDERKRQLSFYLGICYLQIGNLAEAEQKLTESLPPKCDDPQWAEVQFQLGCLYFQQRAYVKAKKAFELCEFFADETNTELKQKLSGWLADIDSYIPKEVRERQRID
jgi:tetratricopeptide (TPR) repeat protein